MGWLEGGYQTLIDALEHRSGSSAARSTPATSVEKIVSRGEARGSFRRGSLPAFDFVLCTLAPPMARSLLAPEARCRLPPDHCRYLGVVCLLMRTRRASARTTT